MIDEVYLLWAEDCRAEQAGEQWDKGAAYRVSVVVVGVLVYQMLIKITKLIFRNFPRQDVRFMAFGPKQRGKVWWKNDHQDALVGIPLTAKVQKYLEKIDSCT